MSAPRSRGGLGITSFARDLRTGVRVMVIDGAERLSAVITLHSMRVLHRPHPVGRITSLAVEASEHGKGLGRTLMRAAEKALADAGCNLVEVTSHIRRHRDAHSFYEHMGYEKTSYSFGKSLL